MGEVGPMKVKYDASVDILTITLSDAGIVGSREIAPGTIVDFDEHKNVVSIEILDAADRYSLEKLAQLSFEKTGVASNGS